VLLPVRPRGLLELPSQAQETRERRPRTVRAGDIDRRARLVLKLLWPRFVSPGFSALGLRRRKRREEQQGCSGRQREPTAPEEVPEAGSRRTMLYPETQCEVAVR